MDNIIAVLLMYCLALTFLLVKITEKVKHLENVADIEYRILSRELDELKNSISKLSSTSSTPEK